MKISELTIDFLKVKTQEILKTLPIAHYLRVNTIDIVFDENSPTSFFDMQNYNIHLALANVVMAILGSKKQDIDEIDLEKHIRNSLYHEVSHAILTPQKLFDAIVYRINSEQNAMQNNANYVSNFILTTDLANIIEDERIETLLKDYYLLVNFKENVFNLNDANNGLPNVDTFEKFVFSAVRFRHSPIMQKEVNDAVVNFIVNTKDITSVNSGCLIYEMNQLCLFLKQVWDILCQNQNQQNQNQNQQQDEQDANGGNGNSSSGETSEEESAEQNEGDSSSETNESKENGACKNCGNEDSNDTEESSQSDEGALSQEDAEELIDKTMNAILRNANYYGNRKISLRDFHEDKRTLTQMIKIIVKNVGVGVADSPTQYGYCGKFSAKKFMKDHNESYKWFAKKSYSDDSLSKKSQNKVLNIFLDNSGSFSHNDYEVNKVLKALYEVEKRYPTFKFNLIRWGSSFAEQNGNDRVSQSNLGGTSLYNLSAYYKKYNPSGKEYNILLTDGEIEKWTLCELANLNNNHSIIISESNNKGAMRKYCPNAKAIIFEDYNYADRLAENVVRALDLLF